MIQALSYTTIAVTATSLAYQLFKEQRSLKTSSHSHKQSLIEMQRFKSNDELINYLVEKGEIRDMELERAMKLVDRANYCHNFEQNDRWITTDPYEDAAQPLIANATISAPHMHATCIQAIVSVIKEKLDRNEPVRILDIGSGSGYCCAVIAHIINQCTKDKNLLNQCKIYGVEHVDELVTESLQNLKNDSQLKDLLHLIEIRQGDGLNGIKDESPFDIIHCGAALSDLKTAGATMFSQLSQTGRMIVPIGSHQSYQALCVVEKKADGQSVIQPLMKVRFVPLSNLEAQLDSTYSNHIQPKLFKGGNDTMLVMPFVMNLDDTSGIKSLKDIKWEGSE
jgi:protein-L-isoaspartate(D-aspartate) O-methyltransferase